MREIFRNRIEAGQLLAEKLTCYANQPNVIVLGLPRGGVPVAFEVAKALHVPLDVFVVQKLGTPGRRELAMGAIATRGVRVLNEEVVVGLGVPIDVIDAVTAVGKAGIETARTGLPGQLLRAGGARQNGDPDRRWDRHRLDHASGGARFECPTSRAVHRRCTDRRRLHLPRTAIGGG